MAMIRGGDSRYLLPWWEAGVLLAITVIAAFVLHRFWERPARLWIRRTFLSSSSQNDASPSPQSKGLK